MILVTGATGKVGGAVLEQLLAAGQPARVLARDPSKLGDLVGKVEVAQGDLSRPETLAAAFAGVDKAFLVATGEGTAKLIDNAVEAAKHAGVKHLVMLSSSTVLMEQETIIGRWHRDAETLIKASGLAWTMLQPGGFASNTLGWAGMIKAQGAVFQPQSDAKVAVIDSRDIADVAVLALTQPGHEGKSYPLSGPEGLTAAEQCAKISAAIGKPIRFVGVTDEAAREGMVKAGLPDLLIRAMLELVAHGRVSGGGPLSPVYEQLLGRKGRTFDAWLLANAKAFQ